MKQIKPDVPCLYDWEIRWHILKIVSFKSRGYVDLRVGKRDTLIEMYEKGYLTGQAYLDAQKLLEI